MNNNHNKKRLLEQIKVRISSGNIYPASYNQKALWLLHQADKRNPAYHVCCAAKLFDDVDVSLLERALFFLVDNYSILRTTYYDLGGKLMQIVHPKSQGNIFKKEEFVDLSAEHLDRLFEEEIDRPFDLVKGPILRSKLIIHKGKNLEVKNIYFVLTIHHIAVDFFSFGKLIKELNVLYKNDMKNTVKAEMFSSYVDYTRKENDYIQKIYPKLKKFWGKRINIAPNNKKLSFANADKASEKKAKKSIRVHGKVYEYVLDQNLHQKVNEFGSRVDVTPFIVYFSVFQLVFSRYIYGNRFSVGIPISTRQLFGENDLIGNFANSAVFNVDIDMKNSVGDFLKYVSAEILKIKKHMPYPLLLLSQDIKHKKGVSVASSFFNMMFNFINDSEGSFLGDNSQSKLLDKLLYSSSHGYTGSPYDLLVTIIKTANDKTIVRLSYSTEIFTDDSIKSISAFYNDMLLDFISNENQKLLSLSLIPRFDRRKYYDWNKTDVPLGWHASIIELIEFNVNSKPKKTALCYKENRMSYGELKIKTNALACYLIKNGIKKNDVVALYFEKSFDMVVAMIAIMKVGGIFLPIDISIPVGRVDFLMSDSNARLLLTQSKFASTLSSTKLKIVCLDVENCFMDDELTMGFNRPNPSDPAYIIYTSGSSGSPKGAINSHVGLYNRLAWMKREFNVTQRDVFIQKTSYAFDVSLWEFFLPLISGGKLIIPEENECKNPQKIDGYIKKYKATIVHFVPSMLDLYLDSISELNSNDDKLRAIVCSGEVLPERLLKKFYKFYVAQKRLYNLYGPTEAAIDVSCFLCEQDKEEVFIGRPIDNVQLYVMDDNLSLLPIGVPGELIIAGPSVGLGYVGNENETKEKFIQIEVDGIKKRGYKTGDTVFWTRDGYIAFIGRSDRQVKVNGVRIELNEIENHINKIAGVNSAFVVLDKAPGGENFIAAYIYSKNHSVLENGLRRELLNFIPDYMVPKKFCFLSKVPYLNNGKVDYKKLDENIILSDGLEDKSYVLDLSEEFGVLKRIWQSVVSIKELKGDADFFLLGGHSMSAMRATLKIQEAFKVEFNLSDFFSHSVFIEQLDFIRKIVSEKRHQHYHLPKQNNRRYQKLSSMQNNIWFLQQLCLDSPFYNVYSVFKVSGKVDKKLFLKAISLFLMRHPDLLCVFELNTDERVMQYMKKHFSVIDDIFLHVLYDNKKDAVKGIKDELMKPFNVLGDLLLKIGLVELSQQECCYVFIKTHHLICDGWSMAIILRDLSDAYISMVNDQNYKTESSLYSYFDFVEWQDEFLKGSLFDTQKKFWKNYLKDAPVSPDTLSILDYPRRKPFRFTGKTIKKVIANSVMHRFGSLLQKEGLTVYQGFLAVLTLFFSRYCYSEDVAIGVITPNRNVSAFNNVTGCFANTLVFRESDFSDCSFLEFVKKTRGNLLSILSNQDIPFDSMINNLVEEKTNDITTPFFNIAFVYLSEDEQTLLLPDASCKFITVDTKISKFDLTIYLVPGKNKSHLVFQYNDTLLKRKTVNDIAESVFALCSSAIEARDNKISELSSNSKPLQIQKNVPAEHQKNFPAEHRMSSTNLIDCFNFALKNNSEKDCLLFSNKALTYAELDMLSDKVAFFLIRRYRSFGGNSRYVPLLIEPSFNLIIAILGILKAGCAYVPIDVRWPQERVDYILKDTSSKAIICSELQLNRFSFHHIDIVEIDDVLSSELPFEKALSVDVVSDDIAYLIYTSGTTGNPKGVKVTHKNVCNLLASTDKLFSFRSGDVWTLFHSCAFDFSVWEIWGALAHGCKLLIVPNCVRTNPEKFYDLLIEKKVTVLSQTPTAFKNLSAHEQLLKKAKRNRLRYVVFGGEQLDYSMLSPWVAKHGLGSPKLINMYGITETTVHSTYHRIKKADIENNSLCIGNVLPGVSFLILDKNNKLVQDQAIGELYLSGLSVSQGYLNQRELTQKKFLNGVYGLSCSGQFYKTGDLVKYKPPEGLYYYGRADEQVKLHGYRIELGEIKLALLNLSEVKDCVCLLLDNEGRSSLVAFVVKKTETTPLLLRELLMRKLPVYMMPSVILFVDSIPMTINNKLDLSVLKKVYRDKVKSSNVLNDLKIKQQDVPLAEKIKNIWKDVLKCETVSLNDNYFNLGGDSISLIKICSELKRIGLEVTPHDIFKNQTVSKLVKNLKLKKESRDGAALQSKQIGMSLIQQWFLNYAVANVNFWNQGVLLRMKTACEDLKITNIIEAITRRHNVFCVRFKKTKNGWYQRCKNNTKKIYFYGETINAPMTQALFNTKIREVSSVLNSNLNISEGPVIGLGILRDLVKNETFVVIVIHHLFTDGVSWNIFLRDVDDAFSSSLNNKSKRLFHQEGKGLLFIEKSNQFFESFDLYSYESFWRVVFGHDLKEIATIYSGKKDKNGFFLDQRVSSFVLSQEGMSEINPVFQIAALEGFHFLDVLLVVLSKIFNVLGFDDLLLVDLETHGRVNSFCDIDISNEVGWFTAILPFLIKNESQNKDVFDLVMSTSNKRKKLFKHANEYFCLNLSNMQKNRKQTSSMCFNYLGDITGKYDTFEFVKPINKNIVDPNNARPYFIEINTYILSKQLYFEISYNQKQYSKDEIDDFLSSYQNTLTNVAKNVVDAFKKKKALFKESGFSKSSVLSPLQKTWLSYGKAPYAKDPHLHQPSWDFVGNLNKAALLEAWRFVIKEYAILRTGFLQFNKNITKQVVFKHASDNFFYLDWSCDPKEKQEANLINLKENYRNRGMDLSRPTLIHFYLIRLSKNRHKVLLHSHQTLLDGWSVGMVFKRFFNSYDYLVRKKSIGTTEKVSFSAFTDWIERADHFRYYEFWSNYLSKYKDSVDLLGKKVVYSPLAGNAYLFSIINISTSMVDNLIDCAKATNITVNVLFQAAWSLLIFKRTKKTNIIFGFMSSGRSSEIENVELIAGLLSNVLPFKIELFKEQKFIVWLRKIQEELIKTQEFGNISLPDLKALLRLEKHDLYFNSVINFQNYPFDESLFDNIHDLKIENVIAEERTNYPISLRIVLSKQPIIKVTYNTKYFLENEIEVLLEEYISILTDLSQITCWRSMTMSDIMLKIERR